MDVSVDGVRFFSNFDSGNLAQVIKSEKEDEFMIVIGSDCAGRKPALLNHKCLRQWFYFRMISATARTITLSFENLAPKQFWKIWSNDRDIFVKVHEPEAQWTRKALTSLEKYEPTKMRATVQIDLQPNV
jgi:hypothetical protein